MKVSLDQHVPPPQWQARGDFIQGYANWNWWMTTTFGWNVPKDHAMAVFRQWMRMAAKDVVHEHFRLGWGMGRQTIGRWHFHLLLGLPVSLNSHDVRRIEMLWRSADSSAGFITSERFDPRRGAAWYTAQHPEWSVGVVCPRENLCRRTHCLVGGSPW